MQTKTLRILAAVTITAVAAVAVVQTRDNSGRGTTREATAGPLVPGLLAAVNSVKRIEITGPKGPVTLLYGGGNNGGGKGPNGLDDFRWTVVERAGYAADLDAVKNLVVGLAEAKAVEPRTATPELYARIGVEDPGSPAAASHQAVLKQDDGKVLASVIVGKTANPTAVGAGPRQTYMRRTGEAASWLVETPLDPLDGDPGRWLDKKLPRIARDELASLTVSDGAGTVTLKPDPADAKKLVADGLPGGAMLDTTSADAAAAALSYLSFEDVVKADSAWFDKAPSYVFARKSGGTVTVRAAKHDGAYWLALESKGMTDAAATAGWAYRVYDALGEDLSRPVADYAAKPKEG